MLSTAAIASCPRGTCLRRSRSRSRGMLRFRCKVRILPRVDSGPVSFQIDERGEGEGAGVGFRPLMSARFPISTRSSSVRSWGCIRRSDRRDRGTPVPQWRLHVIRDLDRSPSLSPSSVSWSWSCSIGCSPERRSWITAVSCTRSVTGALNATFASGRPASTRSISLLSVGGEVWMPVCVPVDETVGTVEAAGAEARSPPTSSTAATRPATAVTTAPATAPARASRGPPVPVIDLPPSRSRRRRSK